MILSHCFVWPRDSACERRFLFDTRIGYFNRTRSVTSHRVFLLKARISRGDDVERAGF